MEETAPEMNKAYRVMVWAGWGGSLLLVVIWPLLALPAGVFSKSCEWRPCRLRCCWLALTRAAWAVAHAPGQGRSLAATA